MPIKRLAALAAVFLCLALSACHSPYVETTITNRTGGAVSLIEVDYPDASFGAQQIAAGETFHYRFKILGPTPGPVKISFTTVDRKVHTATGPTLNPGQQGTLSVSLDADGHVEWASGLSPK